MINQQHQDEDNMKNLHILLLILSLCLVSLLPASNAKSFGKIQSFTAQDVPYDDGTGVVLSWKPLPREMRIIQYRVYRGISPDTLFYFGQVEVDPTAGVAAEMMYYYDKDFQMLLSIDSPAKLKKEKHQSAGSPLYDRIPRDPALLNRMLPYFTVLGIFNAENMYKHSLKVKGTDGTVKAGLRVPQFEQMAANPNPGMKYYYTVLAVDEKGKFLPYADIKSAIPYDNPPENSARLAAVFLKDTKEFRIEWQSPSSSYDIAQWQFWLLPNSLIPAFHEWQAQYLMQNGAVAPWTAKAILLYEKPNDYSNFLVVSTQNNRVVNPDGSIGSALPLDNLQDYQIVLAYQDYSGYNAYTMGLPTRIMTSAQLPTKTVFAITDKPDDKGDVNAISFGQPISFVTQASYINARRTKIRINYEISDNIKYKIDGLLFRIYSHQGALIAEIKEPYPDKIIKLSLPKDMAEQNTLKIHTAYRFRKQSKFTDFYVTQSITYDNQAKRFISGDIFYKGENLTKNYYQIFRKSKLQGAFYPTKKISTISRNYDDIINFETTLDKIVNGIDVKTGRILLDPTLTFAVDEKTGMPLSINIYKDEQEKEVKQMQDDIKAMKEQLLSNPSKADSLNQAISMQEAYLNALLNHPVYKQALKEKNPARWLKLFHDEQQKNSRSYAYLLMKTDSDGAFTFSDESEAYYPISNWFNYSFLIALIASILFTGIVIVASYQARRGKDLYLRPIAGLQEIDNAVGRATEMGRPILYVPGWSTIGEITTIASMMILNRVAKKAAEYDTRLLVPNSDYYVMPLAQEMVREAYYEAGRPDSYNPVDIFYVSSDQFPYAAGVNGSMIREKSATNFYMGFFNAEALLMTETGNATGSIQIAGTDAITQVPFFITTCDYTLIGEEFYAASAYLSKDAELVSMLKAQDYFKFLIIFFILLGAILSTFHFNWLTNSFPLE